MIGPNVHSILSVRGYDILNMQEYLNTFNDVSAAPERLMRRIIQTVATNALKTVYPLTSSANLQDLLRLSTSSTRPTTTHSSTTRTSVSWSQPPSTNCGSKPRYHDADRGRMREAYAGLTAADPMTSLSIQDLCLPFLADLGEDTWQTGTGINENEIVVEVTMAVNPMRVALLP